MPQNLVQFHFNPVKLGQILLQFSLQYNVSKSALSKKTGISRDTITNIFSGDTQEVSFEKLFKICCVLGVPMVVIEKLMVQDEDIDFADKIVMYDTASGDVLPATEIDIKEMQVPETVVAVAEAVAAVENPSTPAQNTRTAEEHIAFLQAHVERLTALLDKAISEDIADTKHLILDLKGVTYISSAGLRVLLSAQKKMQKIGSMKVRNVCEEVMDVLEMTGFADILVIE